MDENIDNYIELNRTFRVYQNNKEVNPYSWMMENRAESMDDIINNHNIIVILGDKGAGKTTEIKSKLKSVQSSGIASFFFKLDDLSTHTFKPNENVGLGVITYEEWEGQDLPCIIFLDSIDECRLNNRIGEKDKLKKALDFFKNKFKIGEKCKFIITSRESDWKHDEDISLLEEYLHIPSKLKIDDRENKDLSEDASLETIDLPSVFGNDENVNTIDGSGNVKKAKSVVLVYTILPLESHQIEEIAKNYKVKNFDEFISCSKNGLIPEAFYQTPIECIDTICHFKRYNSIPLKLSEFLHHKLFFRYRELNDKYEDRNKLSLKKIEKISERLAMASILCRKPSIMLRESYSSYASLSDFTSELGNSLSIMDLFPDEEGDVLKNYVNSTLFSSNGSNQVKFYNEYVKNYVVYLWLKERINKGRFYDVKNILFQEFEGKLYPRSSLVIPTIMIAEKECEFRKILINNMPHLLIQHSAYCNLSNIDRIDVLTRVISEYSHRIRDLWGYSANTEMSMHYFANECLINIIKDNYAKSDFETKALLLSILKYIAVSNIDEDIEKNILWETVYTTEYIDLRSKAIATLLKMRNEDIVTKLKDLVKNHKKLLKDYMLYTIISDLYPEYYSIEDVMDVFLLGEVNINKSSYRDVTFFIDKFLYDVSRKNLYSIGHVINYIIDIIDNDGVDTHLSLYIFIVCVQILAKHSSSEDSDNLIDFMLYLQNRFEKLEEHEEDRDINPKYNRSLFDKIKELRKLVNANTKRKFFEKYLKISDNAVKKIRSLLWRLDDRSFVLGFDKADLPALLDVYNALPFDEKKETINALIMSFEEYSDFNIIVNPFLDGKDEKEYYDFAIQKRRENFKEHSSKLNSYEISESELQKKNKKFLNDHLMELRNCEDSIFNALVNLSYEYMKGDGNDSPNLDKMALDFGEAASEAYAEGIKKYWLHCDINNFSPFLEVIGKNKLLKSSIVATAGISLSIKDDNFLINSDIAKRMIYFGCQSLNTLPDWFEAIVTSYPDEAKEVIMLIVRKVFEVEDSNYTFIDKLSRINPNLIDVFYEDIWQCIETKEVKSKNVLKSAIEMLLLSPNANKGAILKVIDENINFRSWSDSIEWVATAFFLNVDSFIKIFNKFKKDISREDFKEFSEVIFSKLERYGNYLYRSEDWKSLDNLSKLIPIVFECISPDEDQHREGVYSPNSRDDAQHFRSTLINIVSNYKYSKKDRHKLIDISNSINSQWYKGMFIRIADNLLMDDSDMEEIFKENDIVSFENGDDFSPCCSEDLFKIVCNKLYHIKNDIELSDYSIKELYHHLSLPENEAYAKKIEKEEFFQKYILKEMRYLAKNLYSSLREPEVNDNKKPDLQVWEKCWCVNIECKIADSWSFNQLVDAIEKQLVGQYLKHPDFQYGVLLLANIKEIRKWYIDGKGYSFDILVEKLQEIADTQYRNFDHIKGIKVLGIKYSLGAKTRKKVKTKNKKKLKHNFNNIKSSG